jgi:YidC/Oxa1 family membrane protein insertase
MFDFIAGPLGQLLFYIYKYLSFESYGLAIIIFTIIIKLVLLPLTIKQQKSSIKMQEMQPKIKEIQDKYKNDKERLNQETMKLYKDGGYNPLGGCLPLLVQFPILIALYSVITSPLRFMFSMTVAQLGAVSQFIVDNGLGTVAKGLSRISDINIINIAAKNGDVMSMLTTAAAKYSNLNLKFLGIDLGLTPTYDTARLFGADMSIWLPLILIPILACLTTWLSIKFATPKQLAPAAKSKPDDKKSAAPDMTKSMALIMPVVTLMFAFSVPAGLGVYWIVSSVVQIVQQFFINKYILKHEKDVKEITVLPAK